MSEAHRDTVLDQFTRQAVPFSTAPGIKDEEALRLVVEAAGTGPDDRAWRDPVSEWALGRDLR